ncbi:MAG: AlpA family phage regulatory protein [Planctomycetes bacterium]|nr:AlpA family phage regulatory protein [Planctomycetota bacterium]
MSNGRTTNEKLFTAQAVGEKLSLSKRAIFRMRSAGLICAPVKVGAGAVRWKQSDIEQWIKWDCCSKQEFEARRESEQC